MLLCNHRNEILGKAACFCLLEVLLHDNLNHPGQFLNHIRRTNKAMAMTATVYNQSVIWYESVSLVTWEKTCFSMQYIIIYTPQYSMDKVGLNGKHQRGATPISTTLDPT